jgi:beta-1,4-mannosyltransferase
MSICKRRNPNKKRIAVVVMGDVDRSPRMINHALSVANMTQSYEADLIGYQGSSLPETVKSHTRIRTRFLSTSFLNIIQKMPRVLYLLYAILRIVFQVIQLSVIFLTEHYDYILMQNPPCVPLLFVVALLKTLRLNKSELIIDWHNYGYSILRVNRVNRGLVFIAKIYEMFFAKWGDHHLCVSRAMQVDLKYKFGIQGTPHVLYDKATKKFRHVNDPKVVHKLCKRAKLVNEEEESKTESTIFTEAKDRTASDAHYREDRPVFLLSSTSYTPDEDFMILVKALDLLH